MKATHREWKLDSHPEHKGFHWRAWVEVERGSWEDED